MQHEAKRGLTALRSSACALLVGLAVLAPGCHTSSDADGRAATGTGTGTDGGAEGGTSDCPTCLPTGPAGAFDACGGRIVTPTGGIAPLEYRKQALAADRATIDCRLGPSFAASHPGAVDDRPTAYEPPRKHTPLGRNGAGLDYELGGPPTDTAPANNTFGSVVDQVLYATDAADDPGAARLSTYDWGDNVIVEHPEAVWWGVAHPQGRNTDPAVDTTYDGAKAAQWTAALGRPLAEAFTMARSTMTWSNDALLVFKPGFLGATGTQTSADTYPVFQFPESKVVMAVAVTSANELTLVAMWDVDQQKGQVAVLANLARGLEPVHTWPYFGLPNAGSYTAFKLMGYVDLPFATPTAIAAAGNTDHPVDGAQQGHWTSLDIQAVRDDTRDGPNQIQVATAGYAVVASRWESKVAFLDLQPVFAFLRDRYLTTDANYREASVTDPALWPYTFDTQPSIAPTIVKVIDVERPTAVLAGARRYADPTFAHVAQLDGTVTSYDVTTLCNATDAKAVDIHAIGTIQVGASPTAMAWPRSDDALEPQASPYFFNNVFAVASRAERQVSWVTATPSGSKVFRVFHDSRMGDPVDIDFDERAYIMTVADFTGKKVINYRFGPTPPDHLVPNLSVGLGVDGKAGVECGGELPFPGTPFKVSSTNVN